MINSSLGGESALLLSALIDKINNWINHSKLLESYLIAENLQEMLENDNQELHHFPVRQGCELDKVPISTALKELQQQSDYLYLLQDIVDEIDHASLIRAEELIAKVIEIRRDDPIDINAHKMLLPNGWLIFAKEASLFLEKHPESCAKLAIKFEIDPLPFFKLIEDKYSPKKGDLNSAFIDYLFSL